MDTRHQKLGDQICTTMCNMRTQLLQIRHDTTSFNKPEEPTMHSSIRRWDNHIECIQIGHRKLNQYDVTGMQVAWTASYKMQKQTLNNTGSTKMDMARQCIKHVDCWTQKRSHPIRPVYKHDIRRLRKAADKKTYISSSEKKGFRVLKSIKMIAAMLTEHVLCVWMATKLW